MLEKYIKINNKLFYDTDSKMIFSHGDSLELVVSRIVQGVRLYAVVVLVDSIVVCYRIK